MSKAIGAPALWVHRETIELLKKGESSIVMVRPECPKNDSQEDWLPLFLEIDKRTSALTKIYAALGELAPGWMQGDDLGDAAVAAIRALSGGAR